MDAAFERALGRIHPRLRDLQGARFVPIRNGQKKPEGRRWSTDANYPYDHTVLAGYLAEGHNYGVLTCIGGLVVLDVDDITRLQALGVIGNLPETFTVRTGRGGLHFYLVCDGLLDRIVLVDPELKDFDGDPLHLGEVQALGQQVVGPGSTHPNSNRYEVINDAPIATISKNVLLQILSPLKQICTEDAIHKAIMRHKTGGSSIGDLIPIDSIAWPRDVKEKTGSEVRGSHPIHGSTSGKNFAVNTSKNCWHCFRHKSGGGPLEWLAVEAGLIWCEDAKPGCLDNKETFKKVLDIAIEKGFDIPEARPKSTTKAFGPTVIDAIKALDSVCDRARTQDKVGFDKFAREKYEGIIQKAVSEGCLSPKEENKAYHFLKRYTQQLKGLGIDYNDIGHITRVGKDENRQPEQREPTIIPVGKELELEDVCESKVVNEGEEDEIVEYKFSPEKACNAIMARYNLVSTPDKAIWVYQDGYYSPQGWENILKTVHVVAGDYFNKHMHAELDEKIYYLTRAGEDPFNKKPYLLCCKNKTIDLLTGDVLEHSPEDLTTDQIPVSFDPKATCPEIVKFIATLTPDEDDRRTLLDIIASGAYRQALYYIAFLIGHGSSGSTVFIELIQAFYGAAFTEAIPLNELIEKQFALSNLRNARYSFGQEIDEVKTAGTSRVKEISGGDWISADVKNKQDRARFRGWTKLIFKGNSMPRFTDNTWGFRRRFIEVVLPYKFVPAVDEKEPNQRQEDPDILEKITTPTELSGLLNLVIARLPEIIKSRRIYRKEGSFEAMKEQVDSVLTFFEKFCLYEQGSYTDKDSLKTRIPVRTLHAKFEKWCGLIKGNLVERRQFGKYVKKFCEDRSPIETTVDGKTETVYAGLFFDQTSFDLEIRRLEMILKNGCNPFRADINRIKTGLEKSQKITNTGCIGLKEDIDTIWDAGVHDVHTTSLVEKDLSSISGISGFRDAKVKNASDFDPVTSGITSGEESKKENFNAYLPLMDKTEKTIRWTDDEPTIETQLKQAQVEAAKREAHFTTPKHHAGLPQAKQES